METRAIIRLIVQLGARIQAGQFVRGIPASEEDRLRVLAGRDEIVFDSEWMRVHRAIQSSLAAAAIEDLSAVEKLREAAYLGAYGACGDPELAAYISDDFGRPLWLTTRILGYRRCGSGTKAGMCRILASHLRRVGCWSQ